MNTVVRLTRDMHPWRNGQDAVLPDALAQKLIADGEAEDPRPFPPPDVVPAGVLEDPEKKFGPILTPKRYLTRKRG